MSGWAWFRLVLPLACGLLSMPAAAQPATDVDPGLRFEQANEAYEAGDYSGAVMLYRRVLESGRESSAVHYNLGNALLKNGELGAAIASYRRAERLSPRRSEIRENLDIARARRADLEPEGGEATLAALRRGLLRRIALHELLIVGDGFYFAAALLAVLLISGRGGRRMRHALTLSAPLAVILLLFVAWEHWVRSAAPEAVVIVKQVEARSGPGEEYTSQFTLHEGAELTIEDQRGDWSVVRWAGDLHGWVERAALERLDARSRTGTQFARGGEHADA